MSSESRPRLEEERAKRESADDPRELLPPLESWSVLLVGFWSAFPDVFESLSRLFLMAVLVFLTLTRGAPLSKEEMVCTQHSFREP